MDKKFKAKYSLSKYNNNLNNVSSNKDLRDGDAVYSNKGLGISLTCSQELFSLFEKTQGGKGSIVIDNNTITDTIYLSQTEVLGANNTDSDHS